MDMRNEMAARTAGDWTVNRIVACAIGIVFTLIGIAGFFVTSSMTPGTLLGLQVDLVHNIVHLLTGIIALVATFTGWSRLFNQIFGIVYLVLGIAGLFYPALYFNGMLLGLIHANAGDHAFHLIVGAIAAAVGFFVREPGYRSTARAY